ncbi:MAG: hypothetical protein EBQ78_03810 [Betaproteobacteria bacterium]|nr:hypothetical protein [Betaproteobacteria bacterium]NBY16775.1 hypothetical protein [Betaproteobacteria bacterium]
MTIEYGYGNATVNLLGRVAQFGRAPAAWRPWFESRAPSCETIFRTPRKPNEYAILPWVGRMT